MRRGDTDRHVRRWIARAIALVEDVCDRAAIAPDCATAYGPSASVAVVAETTFTRGIRRMLGVASLSDLRQDPGRISTHARYSLRRVRWYVRNAAVSLRGRVPAHALARGLSEAEGALDVLVGVVKSAGGELPPFPTPETAADLFDPALGVTT